MDFQEFVGGLSAFSSKGGRDEKLRCECCRVFVWGGLNELTSRLYRNLIMILVLLIRHFHLCEPMLSPIPLLSGCQSP